MGGRLPLTGFFEHTLSTGLCVSGFTHRWFDGESHWEIDGKSEIYENSGIQFLPFNTVYQLLAAEKAKELLNGSRFLMLLFT